MTETRELIGRVGIDTGRLTLCDPCYLTEIKREHDHWYRKAIEENDGDPELWAQVRTVPYHHENGDAPRECSSYKKASFGMFIDTGYGDGSYHVYAIKDSDGAIIRLEIDFEHGWDTEDIERELRATNPGRTYRELMWLNGKKRETTVKERYRKFLNENFDEVTSTSGYSLEFSEKVHKLWLDAVHKRPDGK